MLILRCDYIRTIEITLANIEIHPMLTRYRGDSHNLEKYTIISLCSNYSSEVDLLPIAPCLVRCVNQTMAGFDGVAACEEEMSAQYPVFRAV
jgi:hypothetical protein